MSPASSTDSEKIKIEHRIKNEQVSNNSNFTPQIPKDFVAINIDNLISASAPTTPALDAKMNKMSINELHQHQQQQQQPRPLSNPPTPTQSNKKLSSVNPTGSSSSSTASVSTPAAKGGTNPADGSQPICKNCTTGTTPLWRRDEHGNVLCNACGLFLKLHGRPRPISLKTNVIKSRNRVKHNSSDKDKDKKKPHSKRSSNHNHNHNHNHNSSNHNHKGSENGNRNIIMDKEGNSNVIASGNDMSTLNISENGRLVQSRNISKRDSTSLRTYSPASTNSSGLDTSPSIHETPYFGPNGGPNAPSIVNNGIGNVPSPYLLPSIHDNHKNMTRPSPMVDPSSPSNSCNNGNNNSLKALSWAVTNSFPTPLLSSGNNINNNNNHQNIPGTGGEFQSPVLQSITSPLLLSSTPRVSTSSATSLNVPQLNSRSVIPTVLDQLHSVDSPASPYLSGYQQQSDTRQQPHAVPPLRSSSSTLSSNSNNNSKKSVIPPFSPSNALNGVASPALRALSGQNPHVIASSPSFGPQYSLSNPTSFSLNKPTTISTNNNEITTTTKPVNLSPPHHLSKLSSSQPQLPPLSSVSTLASKSNSISSLLSHSGNNNLLNPQSKTITTMKLRDSSRLSTLSSFNDTEEVSLLKTRISELELVNDLYKTKITELEALELAAREREYLMRRKLDELQILPMQLGLSGGKNFVSSTLMNNQNNHDNESALIIDDSNVRHERPTSMTIPSVRRRRSSIGGHETLDSVRNDLLKQKEKVERKKARYVD